MFLLRLLVSTEIETNIHILKIGGLTFNISYAYGYMYICICLVPLELNLNVSSRVVLYFDHTRDEIGLSGMFGVKLPQNLRLTELKSCHLEFIRPCSYPVNDVYT